MKAFSFAAALGILPAFAGIVADDDLKPSQVRVYTKEAPPPEWTGELWSYTTQSRNRDSWPQRGETKGSATLFHIGECLPDKEGNKPVKYLLFFMSPNHPSAVNPWESGDSTKAWFEGKHSAQAGWMLELGTDVHLVLDPNPEGGWQQAFCCAEFSNGSRAPFYTRYEGGKPQGGFWAERFTNGEDDAKLTGHTLLVPKEYQWKAGTYTLGVEEPPKPEEFETAPDDAFPKPGHYRVWVRGKCPEYEGPLFFYDGSSSLKYAYRPNALSDKSVIVSWPEAAANKNGSKPKMYVLVFTGGKAGSYQPFHTGDQTKKMFSLTEENQADFLVECAADVRQFHDIHASGGWDRLYVVVEFEDGTRAPFMVDAEIASNGAKEFDKKLVKSPCIRTPEGYWKEIGVFKCEE